MPTPTPSLSLILFGRRQCHQETRNKEDLKCVKLDRAKQGLRHSCFTVGVLTIPVMSLVLGRLSLESISRLLQFGVRCYSRSVLSTGIDWLATAHAGCFNEPRQKGARQHHPNPAKKRFAGLMCDSERTTVPRRRSSESPLHGVDRLVQHAQ